MTQLLATRLTDLFGIRLPVLAGVPPEELLREWDRPFPDVPPAGEEVERLTGLLRSLLEHSNHVHHPGYVGHQVAVPWPLATLVEASVRAYLNAINRISRG